MRIQAFLIAAAINLKRLANAFFVISMLLVADFDDQSHHEKNRISLRPDQDRAALCDKQKNGGGEKLDFFNDPMSLLCHDAAMDGARAQYRFGPVMHCNKRRPQTYAVRGIPRGPADDALERYQAGQAPLLGWLREFTMLSKETRCHELRSARVAAR